jgi:glycosyltransferase 2 family protein
MEKPARKWILFVLRWGIAVAGIWWVLSNISLQDHVLVLDEQDRPARLALVRPAAEDAGQFAVVDPDRGERIVSRDRTVNPSDRKKHALVKVQTPQGLHDRMLLGLDLSTDLKRVRRVLVEDGQQGVWVVPAAVAGGYELRVPYPRVEVGLKTMIHSANPRLLWVAVAVFWVVFVITTLRWRMLLGVLDIHLTRRRTFVLNMVGAFYNTFMLGSMGGDLLKAYYASRQTPHRTHAVLSVAIDRIIGLTGLVILGGVMAGFQYTRAESPDDPAAVACRRVALGAACLLGALLVAVLLFGYGSIRRAIGLDFVLQRLPMQKHVQQALGVMRVYRRRPGVVFAALLMTFPVHIIVVISAMLAGKAFGLPLPTEYYFVVVPVIVLSGSLPLSPQGAGVMEFFAILLTQQYGVTVGQALALTMSIRLVQITWNLTGGIFVFRGGYHAPSEKEQAEMEQDEPEAGLAEPAPVQVLAKPE